VGCGSGQLLIRCAKAAPGDYVGLDFWGEDWEYSRAQAERNAALEGVQGLRFVHGSASRLPFAEAAFGRVVSCLTFHEVRDVADKTVSVAEALHVLALMRMRAGLLLRYPVSARPISRSVSGGAPVGTRRRSIRDGAQAVRERAHAVAELIRVQDH